MSRVLAAAVMVFATTADDAVWLTPVLSEYNSNRIGHALAFILTLQAACLLAFGLCVLFGKAMLEVHWEGFSLRLILQLIAIVLTLFLALFFFVRSHLKKTRRKREAAARALNATSANYGAVPSSTPASLQHEMSVTFEEPAEEEAGDGAFPLMNTVSCTFLGALDEIAVFPALFLSNFFSYSDLALGCLIASVAVLVCVWGCLRQVRPLLDFLDRIPLYALVLLFAIIQMLNIATE